MKVFGIICEYNPLHSGHMRMMEALREQGADAIVCAMSGNYVQRGEMAVVNKFVRAEMAVRCGADLVIELPTPWACATAETFARGGVQLLQDTHVVTDLAFGSECGSLAALQEVADVLLSPDFSDALRRHLSLGIPYAAARQRAAAEKLGEKANVLSLPNNILGIEYLKALAQAGKPLHAVTLPRIGAAHDGAAVDGIASASHIRQLLRSGAEQEALALMPPAAAEVLCREIALGRAPVMPEKYERMILCRLRQLDEADFARCDSGSEGLYHRLFRAVQNSTSLEQLYDLAKTKRYSRARLRRMVLSVWLGMAESPERPPYLRVLAAGETGRLLLRQMRDQGAKLLVKPADVSQLGYDAEMLFAEESRRTDLYTLGYPDLAQSACGSDYRATPLMLQ